MTAIRVAFGAHPSFNRTVAGEKETGGEQVASPANHRRSIIMALLCLLITLPTYLLFERFQPLADAEAYLVDYRLRTGRLTSTNPDLIYLSVDQISYESDFPIEPPVEGTAEELRMIDILRGTFPWTREVFGHVADKLINAGAKGVILDFIFSAEKENDEKLKAVLDRHNPKIVIGAMIEESDAMMGFALPSPTLIEPDEFGDSLGDPRVGFVNVSSDSDGVVRRGLYADGMYSLMRDYLTSQEVTDGGPPIYTLAARGMMLLGYSNSIPFGPDRPLFRYTGPGGSFNTISLKQIVDPRKWQTQLGGGEALRDKLIIIGPGASVFPDEQATPFGRFGPKMDGAELHLNLINAGIQKELIAETDSPTNRAIVLATGAVLLLLTLGVSRPLIRFGTGLLITGAYLISAMWFYDQQNLMIQVLATPPLLLNAGVFLTVLLDIDLKPKEVVPIPAPDSKQESIQGL